MLCHDARNLPVCVRLSECEIVVVCLRLNYICQEILTVIFGLFPGDENSTCQPERVTCKISTRPAVLTLKLTSGHALKEITLFFA